MPRIDPTTVKGWGVDADLENDPVYPMRDRSKESRDGSNWPRPALQEADVEVLQSSEHKRRPAVIGTSAPPSGISGAIRRKAFEFSEGRWTHWLMLLAADRINMVEGVLDDLSRGRVPNIPAEMGIRAEMKHNMPGLVRKVMVAGAVVAAFTLLRRNAMHSRRRRRRYW